MNLKIVSIVLIVIIILILLLKPKQQVSSPTNKQIYQYIIDQRYNKGWLSFPPKQLTCSNQYTGTVCGYPDLGSAQTVCNNQINCKGVWYNPTLKPASYVLTDSLSSLPDPSGANTMFYRRV